MVATIAFGMVSTNNVLCCLDLTKSLEVSIRTNAVLDPCTAAGAWMTYGLQDVIFLKPGTQYPG
jgi:hypothetical protein